MWKYFRDTPGQDKFNTVVKNYYQDTKVRNIPFSFIGTFMPIFWHIIRSNFWGFNFHFVSFLLDWREFATDIVLLSDHKHRESKYADGCLHPDERIKLFTHEHWHTRTPGWHAHVQCNRNHALGAWCAAVISTTLRAHWRLSTNRFDALSRMHYYFTELRHVY